MKMTTAIFDLDGTLLNSLGDLCDSVTYAVEKHGFPPVSMEQTRIRIGNGVRKLVERSIPEESRTDEMIDICLADFRAFYGEHMMNRTHPYEGIVSVLETLKENGVTVGKRSNKTIPPRKRLIEHYFGDLSALPMVKRLNIPASLIRTSVLGLLMSTSKKPRCTSATARSDHADRSKRRTDRCGRCMGFCSTARSHPVRTRLRMSRAICCHCSSTACPM